MIFYYNIITIVVYVCCNLESVNGIGSKYSDVIVFLKYFRPKKYMRKTKPNNKATDVIDTWY